MRDLILPAEASVRLIALYLPQFHPIPENDMWWGKGFTEWTNVVKAGPLFHGHPQPDLPADLGFYDLRLADTRREQAALAREHGVFGFCYYHYWFSGRRVLDRPFREVLESGQPDFPFCLCWANENWTRAWDGHDRDVLLRQDHTTADDRAHIRWLADAMRDPRYIRVDDKPLLLVYRPSKLVRSPSTADVWREEARALGVGELCLVGVAAFPEDRIDPATFGFDASMEFQPNWDNLGPPVLQTDAVRVFNYRDVAIRAWTHPAPTHRHYHCVLPGWDNSPRRRRGAVVLDAATPEVYAEWLEQAIDRSMPHRDGSRIVFLNAWNEWAEGAHLEPGVRWSRDYLDATGGTLKNRTS